LKHNVLIAVCVVAAVLATGGSSHGAIIDNIDANPPDISPNGDGVADSMIITYDIGDTANAVYLLIVQSDSTTVVDTLVDGVAYSAGSQGVAVWDGTVAGGIRVADDDYFVLLRATNDTATESWFVPVSVDVVAPQSFITSRNPPDVFAPGSPDDNQSRELTVRFQTFDPHPSDEIAVRVWITDPAGDTVQTILPNTLVPPIGSHTVKWDGETAEDDGVHQVRIVAADRAGNRDNAWASFRVDLDSPELEVTSLETGQRLQVIPDSLYGFAWDSGGDPLNKTVPMIDSLFVRYSGGPEALAGYDVHPRFPRGGQSGPDPDRTVFHHVGYDTTGRTGSRSTSESNTQPRACARRDGQHRHGCDAHIPKRLVDRHDPAEPGRCARVAAPDHTCPGREPDLLGSRRCGRQRERPVQCY
jgi:hypothetical protein